MRPGNAASNTTADHVELLAMALAQLPVDPEAVEIVARADSAALTHRQAVRTGSVRSKPTENRMCADGQASTNPCRQHSLAGRLGLLLADTGHHCTVPGRSMASSGSGNSLLPVGVVYAFDSRLPLP